MRSHVAAAFCAFAFTFLAFEAWGQPPMPVGMWDFQDADAPMAATRGADLAFTGTFERIPGPTGDEGAIRFDSSGYLTCTHGIAPAAGEKVNAYTIVVDLRLDLKRRRTSFFQTDVEGKGPLCEILNKEKVVGITTTGYTGARAFQPNIWHRMAIAVDNSQGRYDVYLNGEKVLDGSPQAVDGEYALGPEVLFFAETEVEPNVVDVAQIAIYDAPLDDDQIRVLGNAYGDRQTNAVPDVVITGLSETVEAGATVDLAIKGTDLDNDPLSYTIDWGDGAASAWSPLQPSGEIYLAHYAYAEPGEKNIIVNVRDIQGGETAAPRVAKLTVTGTSRAAVLTPPFQQNLTKDGLHLMWETNAPLACKVKFGAPGKLDREATATGSYVGEGSFVYTAELTGFDAGEAGEYQVVVGDIWTSEPTPFRTAPETFEPFSFGVWGDSQGTNHDTFKEDPYEPTKAMFRHMAANGVAFGVGAGDFAENGDLYADTRQYYLNRAAACLGVSVPYYLAWGNHDSYRGSNIRNYAVMPSKDRPGFDPGYGSFSFEYAECHFVCIDYANMMPDIRSWLEADLKAAREKNARHIFVFIHVPPYCELWIDGEEPLREELVPLLEKYKVDVCFSGHTHEYERGENNGVYYCVCGGGSWLDHGEPVVKDWPFMTVGGAQDLPGYKNGLVNHYVRVDVTEEGWTATMIAFDPSGKELQAMDTFSSKK